MSANSEISVDISTQILEYYMSIACPCAFPRFVFLAGFNHKAYNAGPVMCFDTDAIVNQLIFQRIQYLIPTTDWYTNKNHENERMFECPHCASQYRANTLEYSTNFETSMLTLTQHKCHNVGAPVLRPFHIYAGLGGFQRSDIHQCHTDFKSVSQAEYINYMTAQ